MQNSPSLPKATLLHIARLARLRLSEAEVALYTDQIGAILAYVESLQSLDTSSIPPMSHASSLHSSLRPDLPLDTLRPQDALRNAPSRLGDLFTVPKVLDE